MATPKTFKIKHIDRFMGKQYGKDIPEENIIQDPRVKKFFYAVIIYSRSFTANRKRN